MIIVNDRVKWHGTGYVGVLNIKMEGKDGMGMSGRFGCLSLKFR